jgi:hypothetical protein
MGIFEVTICDLKHRARRSSLCALCVHGTRCGDAVGSAQAIAVNIEIMRAFVRLREVIVSNKELAARLDDLENKSDLMSLQHDTFAHNTRVQLKQIFDAIRELMAPPPLPPKRPIGFVTPEDVPDKTKAAKTKK